MYSNFENPPKIISLIKDGKIGVIPTDTIYGIVGSAFNEKAVEKIYLLRKRNRDKPFIILISSLSDLGKFGISLTQKQSDFLKQHWPNPLSVVLSCDDPSFKYLHRGTNSLAFRMPNDKGLLDLLSNVGPLVAPSANPESEKPAEIIGEAKKYFGDKIDFYVDGGKIKSPPSILIKLNEDGTWKILRKGSYQPLT